MVDRSKAQKRDSREQRLHAALRENLKRRKAQARGRGSAAEDDTASPNENGDDHAQAKDES
jgi:hypothetical protein